MITFRVLAGHQATACPQQGTPTCYQCKHLDDTCLREKLIHALDHRQPARSLEQGLHQPPSSQDLLPSTHTSLHSTFLTSLTTPSILSAVNPATSRLNAPKLPPLTPVPLATVVPPRPVSATDVARTVTSAETVPRPVPVGSSRAVRVDSVVARLATTAGTSGSSHS